ncbi:aquaporin-8-like [Ambystoma mexicanum]|uniref:aquaporin-8-like n=1 Tax=Ambystoma mexicanum TaxID=8296 RepID=UPI0037E93D37
MVDWAQERKDSDEANIVEKYIQPCVAEFIGTTLFIATACLSTLTNPMDTGVVHPALAHGLALGALVAAFWKISGGHFNPCVSLAVFIAGGISPILLGLYLVVQLIGGLLGALLAKLLNGQGAPINNNSWAACSVGPGSSIGSALGTEIIFSSTLILVVLMVAVERHTRTGLAPMAIGFVVVAGMLGGTTISGCCLNPVRAFGPAVVWNFWEHHWIYWVGPLISALLMALTYRLVLSGRSHRWILCGEGRNVFTSKKPPPEKKKRPPSPVRITKDEPQKESS